MLSVLAMMLKLFLVAAVMAPVLIYGFRFYTLNWRLFRDPRTREQIRAGEWSEDVPPLGSVEEVVRNPSLVTIAASLLLGTLSGPVMLFVVYSAVVTGRMGAISRAATPLHYWREIASFALLGLGSLSLFCWALWHLSRRVRRMLGPD